MSDQRNGFRGLHGAGVPALPDESERLVDEMGELLVRMLTGPFGIPEQTAPALLEEVFFEFSKARKTNRASDAAGWLVQTATQYAREWLRLRGLPEPPEEEVIAAGNRVRRQYFAQKAMGILTDCARRALTMRLVEGKSYEEIAEELEISLPYAKALVTGAEAKMRKWGREE